MEHVLLYSIPEGLLSPFDYRLHSGSYENCENT